MAPATPLRHPLSSTAEAPVAVRLRNLLCVVRGREEDRLVLEHACGLARAHAARLKVMHVWAPTLWIHWTGLAGARPDELISDCESQEARWLHQLVADLPSDMPCTCVCRRGRLRHDVADEVVAGRHDCVVIGRDVLGRRWGARLRRLDPELRIVLARAARTQP